MNGRFTSARRVIVTGAGGPAGRSVAHQLVARGHAVLGLDATTLTSDTFETGVIPLAYEADFAGSLFERARHWNADLIIPTVTEELLVPELHEPQEHWAIAIGPADAVTIANDKWRTAEAMSQAGLGIPHSAQADGGSHKTPQIWLAGVPDAATVLLSKPRVGRGGRGVEVHKTHDSAFTSGSDCIVQEFVTGTEYVVNLFVSPTDHAVTAMAVLEKTELAQGDVGNAIRVSRLEPEAELDIRELATSAVHAIGLTGPADIDIRRRASGEPVLLEINARFGAHSAHVPEILDQVLKSYSPVDR